MPHLDVAHVKGRDLVWCASLDLAWRALTEVVGGPIRIASDESVANVEHDRALSLARALNTSPVNDAVADAKDYVALAGEQTATFIENAHATLVDRFGGVEGALIPSVPQPGMLAALAYANINARFTTSFAARTRGMRFDGRAVDAFGIWERSQDVDPSVYNARIAQVRIHHHRFAFEYDPPGHFEDEGPSEEFVVELGADDADVRVIVGCFLPERTFAGTIALCLSRVREDDMTAESRLRPDEKLVLPVVDIRAKQRLSELWSRGIDNPGFSRHRFGEVLQTVRFTLDEGGARVESAAVFGGLSLPPRSLVCNAPFLVLLQRRRSRIPFFAAWVETDALLREG